MDARGRGIEAHYHLTENVSVERALSYIGINAVKEVLLFSSLMRTETRDPNLALHLHDISDHSMLVNCALSELYRLRFGIRLPEQYSSIGITHDIGKIIMLGHIPERYEAAASHMLANPGTDFYQSELALGFAGSTHAEIGAFFLDLLRLPRVSVEHASTIMTPKPPARSTHDILETCRMANRLANWPAFDPEGQEKELPAFLDDIAPLNDQSPATLVANLRNRQKMGHAVGT